MTLQEGVRQYVLRRRAEGIAFERGASTFELLCKHLGPIRVDEIVSDHVLSFLDSLPIATNTWRLKHQMLKRFFDFWAAYGVVKKIPMPPQRVKEPRRFTPHIYTKEELRSLLKAIRSDHKPKRTIGPQTLKTFILLLYGTGALSGEVLTLRDKDIDLESNLITIDSHRCNRSRRIPIGSDLRVVLANYRRYRSRNGFINERFLVTNLDRQLSTTSVVVRFARLRLVSGLVRADCSVHHPRINDLKFTFAVHRITSWIKSGIDLNRMLPALAAYMGQVDLGATARYLSLTPERFRKELDVLSPAKSRKRWRDQPGLLTFIASL